jgi:hypothetical protein
VPETVPQTAFVTVAGPQLVVVCKRHVEPPTPRQAAVASTSVAFPVALQL